MRYPLPYAFARTQQLLLEDDNSRLCLWVHAATPPSAISEVMRKYRIDLKSVELSEANLKATDCVLILTDHDAVKYADIAKHAKLVVDTRNAMASVPAGTGKARVVKS